MNYQKSTFEQQGRVERPKGNNENLTQWIEYLFLALAVYIPQNSSFLLI